LHIKSEWCLPFLSSFLALLGVVAILSRNGFANLTPGMFGLIVTTHISQQWPIDASLVAVASCPPFPAPDHALPEAAFAVDCQNTVKLVARLPFSSCKAVVAGLLYLCTEVHCPVSTSLCYSVLVIYVGDDQTGRRPLEKISAICFKTITLG
jgi:hypothetical protein